MILSSEVFSRTLCYESVTWVLQACEFGPLAAYVQKPLKPLNLGSMQRKF